MALKGIIDRHSLVKNDTIEDYGLGCDHGFRDFSFMDFSKSCMIYKSLAKKLKKAGGHDLRKAHRPLENDAIKNSTL